MKVFIDMDEAETTFPEPVTTLPEAKNIPTPWPLCGEGTLERVNAIWAKVIGRRRKNKKTRYRQMKKVIIRNLTLWDGSITDRNIWLYIRVTALLLGNYLAGKPIPPKDVLMSQVIMEHLAPHYLGVKRR